MSFINTKAHHSAKCSIWKENFNQDVEFCISFQFPIFALPAQIVTSLLWNNNKSRHKSGKACKMMVIWTQTGLDIPIIQNITCTSCFYGNAINWSIVGGKRGWEGLNSQKVSPWHKTGKQSTGCQHTVKDERPWFVHGKQLAFEQN